MSIIEFTKLEKKDRKAYEESLKKYRDLKSVLDSSFEQGIEQGVHMNTAMGSINFFNNGVPVSVIAKSFEITEEAVYVILKDAALITDHGGQ